MRHGSGPTVRATWQGVILAQSDETILVEGNHYFPRESLVAEHFEPSETVSVCPWKGVASYYDVVVDGEVVPDAAFEYHRPWIFARRIKERVAFWGGVRVEPVDPR